MAQDRFGMLRIDATALLAGLERYRRGVRAAAVQGIGEAALQLLNDCVTDPPTVPLRAFTPQRR